MPTFTRLLICTTSTVWNTIASEGMSVVTGSFPTSINLQYIVNEWMGLSSLSYVLFSFPLCVLVLCHLFSSLQIYIVNLLGSASVREGLPFKQDTITSWITTLFAEQVLADWAFADRSVCGSSVCNRTSITKAQRRRWRVLIEKQVSLHLPNSIPAAGYGGVFWRLLSTARPTPCEWEQKWRYIFAITCIQGM